MAQPCTGSFPLELQASHLRNLERQLSGACLGAGVRIERGEEGGAGGGNVAEQEHLRRCCRIVGRAPQRQVCRPAAAAERSTPQHVAVPAVHPKHLACTLILILYMYIYTVYVTAPQTVCLHINPQLSLIYICTKVYKSMKICC